MKIVLIFITTIAVSSSAMLFPNENDVYNVSYDLINRMGRLIDVSSKVNFLERSDNEEDNLKPRSMIKNYDFGIHNELRISKSNKAATIKPLKKETNNQEKVQSKTLHKRFNFYGKRISKKSNRPRMNESIERIKIRDSALPVKLTKYSTEEKQDQKEFIFMKNNHLRVHETKNKRRKRSSNIIEEENIFTTVSALKYTGQDTRIRSNLYFKNINQ